MEISERERVLGIIEALRERIITHHQVGFHVRWGEHCPICGPLQGEDVFGLIDQAWGVMGFQRPKVGDEVVILRRGTPDLDSLWAGQVGRITDIDYPHGGARIQTTQGLVWWRLVWLAPVGKST